MILGKELVSRYFSEKDEKPIDEKVAGYVGAGALGTALASGGVAIHGSRKVTKGGVELANMTERAAEIAEKNINKETLQNIKKDATHVRWRLRNQPGKFLGDIIHGKPDAFGETSGRVLADAIELSTFKKRAAEAQEKIAKGIKLSKRGYKGMKIAGGVGAAAAVYSGVKKRKRKKLEREEEMSKSFSILDSRYFSKKEDNIELIKDGAKTAGITVGTGALLGAGLTGAENRLEKLGRSFIKKHGSKSIINRAGIGSAGETIITRGLKNFVGNNVESLTDRVPKIVTKETLKKNIKGGVKTALPLAAIATAASVVAKKQSQKKRDKKNNDKNN